ncbi:hypothetical protein LXL04_021325 [Taraxacum kok-saghyz]
MSHDLDDDADYIADEHEVEDVENHISDDLHGADDAGGSDSEIDEQYHMNYKSGDTYAAQARKGKDIQGIPWERLSITREQYRQTRLEQYKKYENVPLSGETSQKHDVYYMSHFSVLHWSSLTCKNSSVLNVAGHVAPHEKHPGSLLEGFNQTQVSTLAVKDNLLVAGGFQGELICKYLDRPGVCYCSRASYDDNAITNVVDIYTTTSHSELRFGMRHSLFLYGVV